MRVNILEAKNQLSRLVRVACEGEEVIIASHDQAQVRLVPCRTSQGLSHWGILAGEAMVDDAAFTPQADAEVGKLFDMP